MLELSELVTLRDLPPTLSSSFSIHPSFSIRPPIHRPGRDGAFIANWLNALESHSCANCQQNPFGMILLQKKPGGLLMHNFKFWSNSRRISTYMKSPVQVAQNQHFQIAGLKVHLESAHAKQGPRSYFSLNFNSRPRTDLQWVGRCYQEVQPK